MPVLRPDADHDAVCTSTAQHVLVTAPPGTGKTCLSVRLAAELSRGLSSGGRVLLLTFSNQARVQLEREAARQLSTPQRRQVEVTNYHRFFWHAVRAYRRALGLPLAIDIGSTARRQRALDPIAPAIVTQLARQKALDELAEQEFTDFRADPAVDEPTLSALLAALGDEQRAGRLVFGDLGALFWRLLDRFPAVEAAYRHRYPIVIADEHQDASALQDAVVRRLGHQRRIIFADERQLIHAWRGARRERIEAHRRDGAALLTLRTPHRWHGDGDVGAWLLAVRARLDGDDVALAPPPTFGINRSVTAHGFPGGVKHLVNYAVLNGFGSDARNVAVLARTGEAALAIRDYLCGQGRHPRQVGGEFDFAREDIEALPDLTTPEAAARRVVDRLGLLCPTLKPAVLQQLRRRISVASLDTHRAGLTAAPLLEALQVVYQAGSSAYFRALDRALQVCADGGERIPHVELRRCLRQAVARAGEQPSLEDALDAYAKQVLAAAHHAPPHGSGLYVMTVHQAKGKEFDAVVIADGFRRFYGDDDEGRNLFYVALTRGTKRWTVIAPDDDAQASPLLRQLQ